VSSDAGWLESYIRDVPDFPTPGILFKDLTPLLGDPEAFRYAVDALADHAASFDAVDKVVGVEARGFTFAAAVAYKLGVGLIPVRKPGKLPWDTMSETYDLEYGSDSLEVHKDAVTPGESVYVIDDVLATGGTAMATSRLVEALGGRVVGLAFVVELGFLEGRAKLADHGVSSLVTY
jgi:adenine phosphoribosyltransferase